MFWNKENLRDPIFRSLMMGQCKLRSYQADAMRNIYDAVMNGKGGRFAVTFPRQSGKNEMQAQLEAAGYEVDLQYASNDVQTQLSQVENMINSGADVLESLSPAQMVIKIVNEELCSLMGGANAKLNISSKLPSVVMLVGLQGAGKTTNGAKLAAYMRRQGKRPLLAACDIYRPAAIKQLETVGKQLDLPVFQMGQTDPVRLHIDEELMDELRRIRDAVEPAEILLVVDAMTGQDAVNAATAFDEALGVTGVMLTKLDGDARGGAALSIRAATGKPIKFIGVGEKLDMIEPFHPDRMASRILGMGDVLTLIEKAEQSFDEKKALEAAERLKANRFTLTDYLDQMSQLKNMGDLESLASMIPGMNAGALKGAKIDDRLMARQEAIILSMTPAERENPSLLNSSRKKRVAAGSGTQVVDVNRLIKQFEAMQQMMKQFSGKNMKKMQKKLGRMGGMGGLGGLGGLGGFGF